jgi:hypothetical protein
LVKWAGIVPRAFGGFAAHLKGMSFMNRIVLPVLACALTAHAQAPSSPSGSVTQLLDRIVAQERAFVVSMKKHAPLVETYIQETPQTESGDAPPNKDHYFLGRVHLGESLTYDSLVEHTDPAPKGSRLGPFHFGSKTQPVTFLPLGFAQMAFLDLTDFNRAIYNIEYARREFLGDVRCLVFDVSPRNPIDPGRFTGRVWVEDQDDRIVRFDGIYIQPPPAKGAPPERYFHFDSWRENVAPGVWAPSHIYVEEAGEQGKKLHSEPRFKAQTRFWDYAAQPTNKLDELTSILVESASEVKDQSATQDASPLESQRSWERQAEENILARLEKGGLLAPPGPVDDVLNTVVNNLIVSADLNVEAHCRVLLTTPVETFSAGHTIVISRGLIDVLPDEVSLALVLAAELSHIALSHRTPTQFAFHNQTMLSDAEVLQKFHFARTGQEMAAAGRKTIEIMKASPYQKTANAGLFLQALIKRGPVLPRLLAANLGNQVAEPDALSALAEFAAGSPALEEDKIEQIAALPLGSRIKLNPWSNRITLVNARPLALLSPREKMAFEISPFALHLTRIELAAK